MRGWNGWYHCTIHTYGSWLHGDPRGWRARHHREHVDGDYKNPPPPGKYDATLRYSRTLMKRAPVRIPPKLRDIVLDDFTRRLSELGVEVLIASMDSNHMHVLARFPDHNARKLLAIAKQYTTAQLKAHRSAVGLNLKISEGLWSKRTRSEPIRDRAHQLNTFRYIHSHRKLNAAIWINPQVKDRAKQRVNR